jgi:ribosomal protein L15
VTVHRVSASVRQAIEAAGGSVIEIDVPPSESVQGE